MYCAKLRRGIMVCGHRSTLFGVARYPMPRVLSMRFVYAVLVPRFVIISGLKINCDDM